MIRHWLPTDIAAVAEAMLTLRQGYIYELIPEYQVTNDEMAKWLIQVYTDPRSTAILAVNEDQTIQAVAGVTYGELTYPPYLRVLYEWCLWSSDRKALAGAWHEAKRWAKARGAVLAKRSSYQEDVTKELVKWEKLV